MRKQVIAHELLKWPKTRLVHYIRGLEKDLGIGHGRSRNEKKQRSSFDMNTYRRRKVALLVSYDGAGYNGFAAQTETDNTTENALFVALKKTCLIQDEDSCGYSRCGRTDKEVNAMGQVLSLDLRSKLRKGILFSPPIVQNNCKEEKEEEEEEIDELQIKVQSDFRGEHVEAVINLSRDATLKELLVASDNALGIARDDVCDVVVGKNNTKLSDSSLLIEQLKIGDDDVVTLIASNDDDKEEEEEELDYVRMLNGVLPPEIRVLGWSPVPRAFDARFSCKSRTYRYFFPARNLDIKSMQDAASRLVGYNDHRNFCKMDCINVWNFKREILSCRIFEANPLLRFPNEKKTADKDRRVFAFEVRGRGFLWHQVRCLIAVLLNVGQRLEKPEVVDSLLDSEFVKKGKPLYALAPAYPLLFYHCEFEGLKWRRTPCASRGIRKTLEERWCRTVVELASIQTQIDFLGQPKDAYEVLFDRTQTSDYTHDYGERFGSLKAKHRPLMSREREKTYEERIDGLCGKPLKRFKQNIAKREAHGGKTYDRTE